MIYDPHQQCVQYLVEFSLAGDAKRQVSFNMQDLTENGDYMDPSVGKLTSLMKRVYL